MNRTAGVYRYSIFVSKRSFPVTWQTFSNTIRETLLFAMETDICDAIINSIGIWHYIAMFWKHFMLKFDFIVHRVGVCRFSQFLQNQIFTISAESVAECRYYRPCCVQLNTTNKIYFLVRHAAVSYLFFYKITILRYYTLHKNTFGLFQIFLFFLQMSHLWYTVSENEPVHGWVDELCWR